MSAEFAHILPVWRVLHCFAFHLLSSVPLSFYAIHRAVLLYCCISFLIFLVVAVARACHLFLSIDTNTLVRPLSPPHACVDRRRDTCVERDIESPRSLRCCSTFFVVHVDTFRHGDGVAIGKAETQSGKKMKIKKWTHSKGMCTYDTSIDLLLAGMQRDAPIPCHGGGWCSLLPGAIFYF